jgi:hypothetical protein
MRRLIQIVALYAAIWRTFSSVPVLEVGGDAGARKVWLQIICDITA